MKTLTSLIAKIYFEIIQITIMTKKKSFTISPPEYLFSVRQFIDLEGDVAGQRKDFLAFPTPVIPWTSASKRQRERQEKKPSASSGGFAMAHSTMNGHHNLNKMVYKLVLTGGEYASIFPRFTCIEGKKEGYSVVIELMYGVFPP